ncbi:aminoglycoside phosphotransferase family protein [Streptomyces sp. NPDC056361]|uniref:aminoglycoside phosphotransferase family protein n=1 Tax=Streptomyces sp. NPDC056361 TaxID=3345795 RepID=UPI0035DD0F95
MTPVSPESRISLVTLLLATDFAVLPTSVVAGPAGTDTQNYIARAESGRHWFVKTYTPATDLAKAEDAAALSEHARLCGVPVAPALYTANENRLIARHPWLAMSVTRFIPHAITADGRLTGRRWEAVGEAVGRLHRGFGRHGFGTHGSPQHGSPRHGFGRHGSPRHGFGRQGFGTHGLGPPLIGPRDKSVDMARCKARLEGLLSWYEAAPPVTTFERWAVATAQEKLARLPEVERLLEQVPQAMVSQLVHGDLSGPNVLLKGDSVAALIDFAPPVRRSPVWELGRLALDPRTVLTQPDWPDGLSRLAAAYHHRHPVVGVEELVSVVRLTAAALALSVYPLNTVAAGLGPVTPSLAAYARVRHQASVVLRERLDEAEEVLRERLG